MLAKRPYAFRAATNADSTVVWSLISSVLSGYGIEADLTSTDKDLADLEQNYQQTGGTFLVLTDCDEVIGTVALLRESENTCELCRMYLAPGYRGQGLGRMLLTTALQKATDLGFSEVRLETAKVLKEAIALYRSAGFTLINGTPLGKNCNLIMSRRLR